MFRAAALGLLAVSFLSTPGHAISAQEKMEICKFGAADQKRTGKARTNFISRCMSNADSPRGKPRPQ